MKSNILSAGALIFLLSLQYSSYPVTAQEATPVEASGSMFNLRMKLKKKLLDIALSEVLVDRCLHYFSSNNRQLGDCNHTARAMTKKLDNYFGRFSSVVFHDDLLNLINSQEIEIYLNKTRNYLVNLSSSNMSPSKENLWEWTLQITDGNREKALKWIAVLFQSPYDETVPLYLKDQPVPISGRRNAALLSEVTLLLQKNRHAFNLYPDPIAVSSDAEYHFYVIAYLSYLLKNSEPAREKFAIFVPYLFNTAYESTKQAAILEPTDGFEQLKAVLLDPKPQKIDDKSLDLFEDTYLGYAGAYWGATGTVPSTDFNGFAYSFSVDPIKFNFHFIQSLK